MTNRYNDVALADGMRKNPVIRKEAVEHIVSALDNAHVLQATQEALREATASNGELVEARVVNLGLNNLPASVVESSRLLQFLQVEHEHTIEWVRQQLEQVQRSLDHIPRPPREMLVTSTLHVEEPADDR